MKKTAIILIVNIFVLSSVYCQDIKTGEGESTILLPTTNIGVDVGKASLTFKTNNFPQSKLKPNGFIWGLDVMGKSKEGLSNIFSGSEIVPTSSISTVLGYSFSNSDEISDDYTSKYAKILKDSLNSLSNSFRKSFGADIISEIYKIKSDSAKKYILSKVVPALKVNLNKYEKLQKLLEEMSKDETLQPEIVTSAKTLYSYMKENQTWKEIKSLKVKLESGIENVGSEEYWKLTIYGHFGIKGEKFNIFKGWDSTNIENSFEKETFSGNSGGFGVNYLFNSKWIVGFRYTYQETNNLDELSTNDYKVTTTFTQNTSVGTTQISKTAYPNKYKTAYLNRYDFDLIRFINIGENNVIIADLYLRINESTNQDNLVSYKDLGLSSSFFNMKGKFIGGIYLELPDFEQSVERRKAEEEQELKDWYNRLTFGIYVKYSFSSLANLF
ncbi:hypothetical protein PbJCM13498_41020 [Prolixibacter bellariivorans]|uniref:Uncharacterized protein n=1 Tax=Prolixibacter bellariivorans TaxID=314319 RepID=A0A5M4B4Z1_9BACT|nr:hypothetical protein [Prolixibacter bellariivorans]GET35239.1 hypothetical protein PbJCM13498_41020 [Prolixibacter bellariivorans]